MTISTKKTPIPPNPADITPESLKQLLRSNSFDKYLSYSILKQLVVNWDEMEAFKVGLIDKKGKMIKKRSQMTSDEKKKFSMFDSLIVNLKRIILKHNKNSLYSWAHALRLIKEDVNAGEEGNMDVYIQTVIEMVDQESVMYEDMGAMGGGPTSTAGAVGIGAPSEPHIRVSKSNVMRRKSKLYTGKKKKKKKKITEHTESGDTNREMARYMEQNPDSTILLLDEDTGDISFIRYGKV